MYSFLPETPAWEPAPIGYVAQEYGPGGRVKTVRLDDGRLVVDECTSVSGEVMIQIFDNKDDPRLQILPSNTPRVVKALLKRENRLKYIRMTDFLAIDKDFRLAQAAWVLFNRNRRRGLTTCP